MASALEIAADVFLSTNRVQFSGIIKDMKTIAYIHTNFKEKFGIPRQSGLVDARGEVHFAEPYNNPDAVRGLEGFSHIWIIWGFHQIEKDEWSPTVRPPRLGGNKRMGVFATRSPYHPNRLGLSCVKLIGIEKTSDKGTVLKVTGADLMCGTIIFDIKSYLAFSDSFPDAKSGFADQVFNNDIEVVFSYNAKQALPDGELVKIKNILKQNPKPAYHSDAERIYAMDYGKYTVHFKIDGSKCVVTEIITR